MSVCPQCRFDYDAADSASVPIALTAIGADFQDRLRAAHDPSRLRRRPAEEVWSALEYACHVRDVLLIQRDRLYLALVEDTPSFARMYRDERATLARYNSRDPHDVADQIAVAARLAAEAFSKLDGNQWTRRLIYNWPEARQQNVLWLGAHTVHEGRHHLGDFEAVVTGRLPGMK